MDCWGEWDGDEVGEGAKPSDEVGTNACGEWCAELEADELCELLFPAADADADADERLELENRLRTASGERGEVGPEWFPPIPFPAALETEIRFKDGCVGAPTAKPASCKDRIRSAILPPGL